jgi:hypothetical protein
LNDSQLEIDKKIDFWLQFFISSVVFMYVYGAGAAFVAQLVEALCYKPEGHRFNS